MKHASVLLLAVSVGALSACSTGGEDGGGNGDPGRISSGVLEAELPTEKELAALPQPAQDTVAAFIDLNENTVRSTTFPSGTDVGYSGTTAGAIGDGDELVYLAGDISLVANFDQARIIDGQMGNFNVYEAEDTQTAIPVSGTVDIASGPIDTADYRVSFAGTLSADQQNFEFEGQMFGAFTGDNAATTLGTYTGQVTNAMRETDSLDGVFAATAD